jgi:hypothetical protein
MGRPRRLDQTAKAEIIALISAGLSRTLAAEYVGCAVSTLYNEARRDEQFDRDLRQAAVRPIIWHFQNLRKHAERSWRASAWFLERNYPQQFGRRPPESIAPEELNEMMNIVIDVVARALGQETADKLENQFNKIAQRVQRYAARDARPWERDQRPRVADRFEMRDGDATSQTPPDEEERQWRRARRRWRKRIRWHYQTGTPLRIRRDDGTWEKVDVEGWYKAMQWARPRPNPLSADWHDHCQRMRRKRQRQAAHWDRWLQKMDGPHQARKQAQAPAADSGRVDVPASDPRPADPRSSNPCPADFRPGNPHSHPPASPRGP